jgi:tetratricopeptide (TPR) repeat protein
MKDSIMTYKTIFSGRLEFGNARSYEKVLKMFEHRAENYYRSDILLDPEEVFDETSNSLSVPRFITQSSEKSWKNTMNLLEYVAEYAVAGDLSAWMTDSGKVLRHRMVEPQGDKVAVQAFLKGRELIQETGKESEAKAALSRAIEKFERHALAYERRGYVNFMLKNYEDAIYDYSKSIDINPGNPDPYLGRAFVKIAKEDLAGATADLENAIKKSIPLQPIYWKARRIKGECHMKLEEFEKAAFEFKLFTKRKFSAENPNFKWRKHVFLNYGKSLLECEEYADAIEAFNTGLEIEGKSEELNDADQLLYRGIALKKAGQSGFVNDWKAAANQGSKRAAQLLEENA